MKRTSLSYSKAICVFLTRTFAKNIIEKNSHFYCVLIEVKRRGKKHFIRTKRIMFDFLVTTLDYNLNVFGIIGIWELHAFCKVVSKRFVMSIIPGNINEGSAKDKVSNLQTDEQSRNSKLVFPKALNIV